MFNILELTQALYAVVRRGMKQMSATIGSTLSRPTFRDSRALHERSVLVVWTITSVTSAARMIRSNVTDCTVSRRGKICRRYTSRVRRRWITARSARYQIECLRARMRHVMRRRSTGTGWWTDAQMCMMQIAGIAGSVGPAVTTLRISRWTDWFTFYFYR